MKVNIITLGCSKNTVDSENLAAHLAAQGHIVHFDGQPTPQTNASDALTQSHNHAVRYDAVIINTCGFIGDAKEESVNTIIECVNARTRKSASKKANALTQSSNHTIKIIVCGCLVERYREELSKEIPEVDAWYGVHEWDKIVECVNAGRADKSNTQAFTQSSNQTISRPLATPGHYAYLKIAEGCNRSCSYCAIPLIRGAHHSRPIEDIVAEAKALVAGGVKELIVISQDTTWYGLDLYRRRALGDLLNRLADESGAPWIRLHYTYPASFPDDAIDAIAHHPNICNYIDIPLQHINSRILSSMQRGIDRDGTLRLLEKFRAKLPDAAIRTTLIVGYPGETEAEFEELKDFVRKARFDRMGCFAYSPEEGTAAFSLKDDIPDEMKQQRVSELMAIQEQISLEKNLSRVGKTYRCLVDRMEKDFIVARTEYDSPEVDDEVLISTNCALNIRPGEFITARITSALENDLMAEIVL